MSASPLAAETRRRRTFAIISHPDAGKTTLTEKLLLQGGAIHLAGEVKARGQARRARSDWMKIEQQRGISVTSSVMTFEKDGITFNLLDTPGHEDFSEDTYRTLVPDSQILFGSDYPFFPITHGSGGLAGLGLGADALRAIGRANAQRLLPRWA